jgi:hypothetical protein
LPPVRRRLLAQVHQLRLALQAFEKARVDVGELDDDLVLFDALPLLHEHAADATIHW